MQAYVLARYGDASAMELRDVPEPAAGEGEVLIRVRAVGLNPVDYKIREGKMRLVNRLDLPRVAGSELSGVVEAAGTGVTRFAVGDPVFARVDKKKLGVYAPHAVVNETLVAKMPKSLDFTDTAGLPLAGLTALQALCDELAVAAGDRVFRKQKFTDVLVDYDGALDLTGGQDLSDSFAILKRGAKTVSIAGSPEPTTARVDLGGGPLLTAALGAASAKIRRQARRRGVGYRYISCTQRRGPRHVGRRQ